jgi:hypothetical protein
MSDVTFGRTFLGRIEIESIHASVEASVQQRKCVCFISELFRGTNFRTKVHQHLSRK